MSPTSCLKGSITQAATTTIRGKSVIVWATILKDITISVRRLYEFKMLKKRSTRGIKAIIAAIRYP